MAASSSPQKVASPRMKVLEAQLTNGDSLNPLVELLDLTFGRESPSDTSKAIYSVYRVFVLILTSGKWRFVGDIDEPGIIVRSWIWERLNDYTQFLTGLLRDEERSLRISALQILFSLQKHLSTLHSTSSKPTFHIVHFKKIVCALLLCPSPSRGRRVGNSLDNNHLDLDVRDHFVDIWLNVHDDIRWFFLREAQLILNSATSEDAPANLLSILERWTKFPIDANDLKTWWVEELGTKPHQKKGKSTALQDDHDDSGPDDTDGDDWRKFFDDNDDGPPSLAKPFTPRLFKLSTHQSLHTLASHRAVFTQAWLTLLPRLPVTNQALSTRALNIMHRGVMPHLVRPILVMDWIGTCVDFGGATGLLALNTLLILMREYNLDYPSFYTHLYSFLDRDLLHLKHRARFFRILELSLSSTHLPAALLASFVKRLSRLSLHAPPAAIVVIIPFIYNILKQHPALMRMIHWDDDLSDEFPNDVFRATEEDPNLTQALDSSLWEIHSLKNHYHSAVSTLACIFEEAFTKPGYSIEDFLDHTYDTLISTETAHSIQREPAIDTDAKLDKSVWQGTCGEDVVGELWAFSA